MTASQQIDQLIASLDDWRGQALTTFREVIHSAEPEVIEEWKWMGSPTYSHDGIICVTNAHKHVVKMVFAKGASLADPDGLFNDELGGTTRRAIKLSEGEPIKRGALRKLLRAAVTFNRHNLEARARAKATEKRRPGTASANSPAKRSRGRSTLS